MPSSIQIPDQKDRVADVFSAIEKRCMPLVRQYSVSLAAISHDKVLHNRTGVLYQIGDYYFVITASHNLHEIAKHGVPLFFTDTQFKDGPIHFEKAVMMGTEEEVLDVAVIELDQRTATEISKYKKFLRHNQITMGGAKPCSPYLLYGFPSDWAMRFIAPKLIQSKGLAFVTFLHKGELAEESNYDHNYHMVMSFSRKAPNLDSQEQEYLPKLNGASGCGIWKIGRAAYTNSSYTENDVSLVGIEHRYSDKHNYCLATRIEYALKLITDNYPDTIKMMDVAYQIRR
jgi:hypothetical protein